MSRSKREWSESKDFCNAKHNLHSGRPIGNVVVGIFMVIERIFEHRVHPGGDVLNHLAVDSPKSLILPTLLQGNVSEVVLV